MSRIARAFRDPSRAALIPYLVGGYPDPATFLAVARAVAAAGAGVIEIGIPFSDPVADGPVIQRAGQEAIASGITPGEVLRLTASLRRETDIPIVLMMYANPMVRRGTAAFLRDAHASGADGILVVDIPLEESADYRDAAEREGLDPIMLAAPTTSDARLDAILSAARGYVYLVSTTGVTGVRDTIPADALSLLARVKAKSGTLPVAIGFGISGPAQVSVYARAGADGVIVGSALVKMIAGAGDDRAGIPGQLATFIREMAAASTR